MNRSQTAMVLAKIAAIDNRRLDDVDRNGRPVNGTPILDSWHELIGDLRSEDCLQAVADHRRESADWLMPVHIVDRVKAMRSARVRGLTDEDFTPDIGAVEDGAEARGYVDTLRARRALVLDGVPLADAIRVVPVPAGVPLAADWAPAAVES